MDSQPKLINIEEVKRISNGSFSRYSNPSLNARVFFILKVADVDPYVDDIQKHLKTIKTPDEAMRNILRYVIQHNKIDYTRSWYITLKDKINEFHKRYTRRDLIVGNDIAAFRTLFKLHIRLNLDYNLYDPNNTEELDYFIAAQFASKYHCDRGFIGKATVKIFEYSSCYNNYIRLKNNKYTPSLVSVPRKPLYITEPLDKKMFFQIKDLKDMDFSSYVFIEKPLLSCRIPNIKRFDAKTTKDYLYTLELLMVRARMLKRGYNKFILSIEHMRVCRHINKIVGV